MTLSLHIVKGWCDDICTEMNKFHGGDFYSCDSFSRHFRIWHKDSKKLPVAYVKKAYGWLYEPCIAHKKGPKYSGENGGILWDLTKQEDRESCLALIKAEGLIYVSPGPMVKRGPAAFRDPATFTEKSIKQRIRREQKMKLVSQS